MPTIAERSAWWILIDLGLAVLVTVCGFAFGDTPIGIVMVPGFFASYPIVLLARSIWEWRGESGLWEAFDHDELPGPVAWALGSVLAWWAIIHGVRWAVWVARKRLLVPRP